MLAFLFSDPITFASLTLFSFMVAKNLQTAKGFRNNRNGMDNRDGKGKQECGAKEAGRKRGSFDGMSRAGIPSWPDAAPRAPNNVILKTARTERIPN